MSMHMAGRGKPGRRSKGDRKSQTIRFPRDLYEQAKRAADEAGYEHFGDYVVDVFARAHGRPVQIQPNHQERLQIGA